MRYDMKRPCDNCPFRIDVPPFIRPARAIEILTGDQAFACHKTVDYKGSFEGKLDELTQHCAGVLIILERENKPHQMMRIMERIGGYDQRKLDRKAPVYASIKACVSAHERAHQRVRVRAKRSVRTVSGGLPSLGKRR